MQHRHLNHQTLTLAAIDDVICRGGWTDWIALRNAAIGDMDTLSKIDRVCLPHLADGYAQRYQFWHQYAQSKQAQTTA